MNKREGEGCPRRRRNNTPHIQTEDRDMRAADPSSPVMSAFKAFQLELDTKHDKYERLFKLSRDITIESKRAIFVLHRVTSVPDVEDVLAEADLKLDGVRHKIGQIAEELRGEDLFQFHRAFTPGIQEYVEAVSFLHFIRHRTLISLEEVNAPLVFARDDQETEKDQETVRDDQETVRDDQETEKDDQETEKDNQETVDPPEATPPGTLAPPLTFQVTPTDYLLGVADLTGELMRMCISSVGNGDMATPFQLGQFLRQIHDGFAFIGNTGPYEVSKKLHTLRQSLAKVEDACYTLHVRGSEIPKHMLADVFSSRAALIDPDEGVV